MRHRNRLAAPTLPAPPVNISWAAMGSSLGKSSSAEDDAALLRLLARLHDQVLLLVGDSSLRNQFMQLARVGLSFARDMPAATAIATGEHKGTISLPFPIQQPDRPDSSNGFWGGFPWMAFTTPSNATLMYAKVWGCADTSAVLRRMRSVALLHSRRTKHTNGVAWPPHAVLWNYGLHLLHVYPARPVPSTSLTCAMGYEALVAASARGLRAALPDARLFYRTTNAVCERRFEGPWALSMRAYHCAAVTMGRQRFETALNCNEGRIARVQSGCQKRYNVSLNDCVRTFMDESNARDQRDHARSALRAVASDDAGQHAPPVLFDAFMITEGRCDATVDGRHYPRLLSTINTRWLTLVADGRG